MAILFRLEKSVVFDTESWQLSMIWKIKGAGIGYDDITVLETQYFLFLKRNLFFKDNDVRF